MIVDDEGNSAYERELTADEIVDELLSHQVKATFMVSRESLPDTTGTDDEPGMPIGRRCGSCGKYGHSRRTCPDLKETAEPKPASLGKGGKRCGYCGVAGHMVKTCSVKRKDQSAAEEREPLDEEQWLEASTACTRKLISAEECAEESGLPVEEVRIVYKSSTYEHYLQLRDKGE